MIPMKQIAAALVAIIASLCGAAPAAEAAWLPRFATMGVNPTVNRVRLAGPGTPGTKLAVSLGLADFVVGRTLSGPSNIAIQDATRLTGFLAQDFTIPSANGSIKVTVNRSVYPGTFAAATGAGLVEAYETDSLGNLDKTKPIPNVVRSSVFIADGATLGCGVTTTSGSSYQQMSTCGPGGYIAGPVTAWNPDTGELTINVTSRGGGGTIVSAANAVLLRHYPEIAGSPPGLVMTMASTNTSTPATVYNWDFTNYVENSKRCVFNFGSGSAGALIRLSQITYDWASNILDAQCIFGPFQATQEAFSIDHAKVGWTPFRDATVLTVASDTPAGGYNITVNETIPDYIAGMIPVATSDVQAPFNGRTISLNNANTGNPPFKQWYVFNATHPDSLFPLAINSISGSTLTIASEVDDNVTAPPIRSQISAGDKIYVFHRTGTDGFISGNVCSVTYSDLTSLMDWLYLATPPSGCLDGPPRWSMNLITNTLGSSPTFHQDIIQDAWMTGSADIKMQNNVIQNVKLNGWTGAINPRDITQISNIYAWTSSLEFSDSILDNSGLSGSPFYFDEQGPFPVASVVVDEVNAGNPSNTGDLRVFPLNRGDSVTMTGAGYYMTPATDTVQFAMTVGDVFMVDGLPAFLSSALTTSRAVVGKFYAATGRGNNNVPVGVNMVAPFPTAASPQITMGSTSGFVKGMPIYLSGSGGTIYTNVASVDSATQLTPAAGAITQTWTSGKVNYYPSFTIANSAAAAVNLTQPWIGTLKVTVDSTGAVSGASRVCLTDASQVGARMLLTQPSAIKPFSGSYPLFVASVDGNCLNLSGKTTSAIPANSTFYVSTWSKPGMEKLISMHDLYIKQPTYVEARGTASGFQKGLFPGYFYPGLPTLKTYSAYNIFNITDNEGTYGYTADQYASIDQTAPRTNPLRFSNLQTWPSITAAVDAPYLVPITGSPTLASFTLPPTVDFPATGASWPATNPYVNITAFNPPCPAPTGLTATPSGTGLVTLTYTAATDCGTGAGKGTNFGETVSIDGGAFRDPLGNLIHSGSQVAVPSGTHTIAVRSWDMLDDFNVPRNPGPATAPVSATVQ